mgnify:CR=1 FL=1
MLSTSFNKFSRNYFVLPRSRFTNKWMNYAILVSLVLILIVVYVPMLNEPFGTEPLGWLQWVEILPLILIPSVVAEVTKYVLSKKA